VLTSGAITHRVDALARAGLVERISGSRDRRSTLVGLTDQGRVVADRAMAANLACEAAMAGLLADADREALAALLKKLLDGLETEEAEVQ
jgi:DNA-binding MarR family transcriptional regulator